jgi:hypothetical protein
LIWFAWLTMFVLLFKSASYKCFIFRLILINVSVYLKSCLFESRRIVINAANSQKPSMFSDVSILSEYKQIISNESLFNATLLNLSLINRFESSKDCSSVSFVQDQQISGSYSSFLLTIMTNGAFNQTKNSLELNYKHLTCENSIELFCSNNYASNKLIVSHSLFDCDENFDSKAIPYSLVTNDNSARNHGLQIISLAPSVSQLHASIKTLMNHFRLNTYAIIYTNELTESTARNQDNMSNRRFQTLAMSLVFKLSAESTFQLSFSTHLHNPSLKSLLNNSNFDSKLSLFLWFRVV